MKPAVLQSSVLWATRRARRSWSAAREAELKRRSELNQSDEEIGLALGFSAGAVKIKRLRLRIGKPMGRKLKQAAVIMPRVIFRPPPSSSKSEFIQAPSLARLMAGR